MIEKRIPAWMQAIRAIQEHITGFTGEKAPASQLSLLDYVHIGNEYSRVRSGYEILFNTAGAYESCKALKTMLLERYNYSASVSRVSAAA